MRLLITLPLILTFVGCQTFSSREEYILKLADKCETIDITPQRTKLNCPNLVETRYGKRTSTVTKTTGK